MQSAHPSSSTIRPVRSTATGLIVVALADHPSHGATELIDRLRAGGASVYVTHGYFGCLRGIAAVEPRMIYLDAALPDRLMQLLRAHPNGRATLITVFDAAAP